MADKFKRTGPNGHMKHLFAEKLAGKHMLMLELESMIGTMQLVCSFLWYDLISAIC